VEVVIEEEEDGEHVEGEAKGMEGEGERRGSGTRGMEATMIPQVYCTWNAGKKWEYMHNKVVHGSKYPNLVAVKETVKL
jgi:hypothetical protein